MTNNPAFSERLKAARAAAGTSQREAAEILDISVRTLQNWEIDSRTPPPYVQKMVLDTLSRPPIHCPNCGYEIK